MSSTFRQFQTLKASALNRAINESGAQAGEAAAAPYATAAAASAASADADATAAAASATAADAAVTAALGPILLTAVAGTSTAYTATASHTPTTGRSYWWTPHTTSGVAAVTLAINGGAARSIRMDDGTQPATGMFRSGAEYLLRYQSNNTFRVLGERDSPYVFTSQNLRRGTSFTISYRDVDATAFDQAQIQMLATGRMLFNAGTGAAAPTLRMDMQAGGNIRIHSGSFLDSSGSALYSVTNPPTITDDGRELAASTAWGPWWETPHVPVGVTSTRPYMISGADLGKHIRVAVASAWIDFETMPINTSILVDVQAGCSATLYSGYSGTVWRNTAGTRLTAAASSAVLVIKGQSDIIACTLYGTAVASSAAAVPTYARKWGFFPGQSWAERETQNAASGIRDKLIALSLNHDVLIVQGVASGASALLYGAASVTTNYWWDPASGTPSNGAAPSTLTDNAIAEVSASPGSPNLTDCIVMLGLNDMTNGVWNTGQNTPAKWTSSMVALASYVRTALALPNLRFWICPLPSQDQGLFTETSWYAMRRAQLEAVATGTDIYRGPDYYDLPRPYGDRHHAYRAQAEHGTRLAKFITNTTDGKTNYLGPKITGFARTAANTFQVTIDRGAGVAFIRPDAPVGFRVVPGGDLFATPLTVSSYAWSGDNLIITTTTDDASPDLCYPYGSAWEMQQFSRIVRAQDASTGEWMPLQTYHPTV